MRITLIVFFLCGLNVTVSAQWWRLRKHEVLPLLEKGHPYSNNNFIGNITLPKPQLKSHPVLLSDYYLEVAEQAVMKTAQHNMRFRIYDLASYNFSELAQLYVQQNRFSEAKWYFLQSTLISRQQNNDRLTISNLNKLAMVKLEIGDFLLAQQDLREARDIAAARGWLRDVIAMEKQLTYIQRNRIASLSSNNRYAELAAEN